MKLKTLCCEAMTRMWQISLRVSVMLLLSMTIVPAQSARPTFDAMLRTFMAQTATGRGTIFCIDIDKREYWITAKHLLTGAKHGPFGSYSSPAANVSILSANADEENWKTINFSVLDPGNDIDIVVLVPPHALLKSPLPSLDASSQMLGVGAECSFLGFPYGWAWKANLMSSNNPAWMPFVKHCSISGSMRENSIWMLDGINNEGFSGGPVVTNIGSKLEIFAVISGYYPELADVVSVPPSAGSAGEGATPHKNDEAKSAEKQTGREVVNVNSGFIVAFDIQPAIDAIHKRPIGPLRGSQ